MVFLHWSCSIYVCILLPDCAYYVLFPRKICALLRCTGLCIKSRVFCENVMCVLSFASVSLWQNGYLHNMERVNAVVEKKGVGYYRYSRAHKGFLSAFFFYIIIIGWLKLSSIYKCTSSSCAKHNTHTHTHILFFIYITRTLFIRLHIEYEIHACLQSGEKRKKG